VQRGATGPADSGHPSGTPACSRPQNRRILRLITAGRKPLCLPAKGARVGDDLPLRSA